MEVKTENGGTFDAAGNGTKGLSIAGLVTGATALVGSGLLGMFGLGNNRWNGNCGNNGFNGYNFSNGFNGFNHCHRNLVTEEEFCQEKAYSSLLSAYDRERSERYTDQSIIAYNKDKFEFNKSIADAIVQDRERLSRLEQYNCSMKEILALREQLMNQKIEGLNNNLHCSVALEAERRCNGDQNLFNYANATFVPGKLVMPISSICPSAMPQYNSWTAPTTAPTTSTTPVVTA